MKKPKNILITGANSGLGKALAIEYASENTNLYLTGRSEKRLEKIKKICEEKGAVVFCKSIEISKSKKMENWINDIYKNNGNIDMVIANAGISAGTEGGAEDTDQVRKIFSTNIDGVINTIHPVIDHMVEDRTGQVVIISSLAGYRGLPSSPAYSASKAAVRVYGEGLRGSLAKNNVGVTVVTPGYIKTPMTDVNNFPMPFLMDADKAAKLITKKLTKNPARIAFPFPLYFVVWLLSVIPPFITDPILANLPGKTSLKD